MMHLEADGKTSNTNNNLPVTFFLIFSFLKYDIQIIWLTIFHNSLLQSCLQQPDAVDVWGVVMQ